ncbi:MAG TPA: hypothetical protein VII63_04920 [Caulobacteraceae bacterium]
MFALALGLLGLLFRQPFLSGIGGHLYVQTMPPRGAFYLVQWQRNPRTPDGLDIPVTWKVGDRSGFYPTGDLAAAQLGFANAPGVTAAQLQGRVMGAWLNSADLPLGSPGQKLGIFPAIDFAAPLIKPFARRDGRLTGSVDMQIPVAVDGDASTSNTYVNFDTVLTNVKDGSKLTYAVTLFFHNHAASPGGVLYDAPSHSTVVVAALQPDNRYVTLRRTSAPTQGSPWRGVKRFAFKITYDEFKHALVDAAAAFPSSNLSTSPEDYELNGTHINVEMHYTAQAPAQMGLSLEDYRLRARDDTDRDADDDD